MASDFEQSSEYFRGAVRTLCFWIAVLAGTLVAAVLIAAAYAVPQEWFHVYASLIWIPPLLVGWYVHVQLFGRIDRNRPTPPRS